jgi:hypothetical protein
MLDSLENFFPQKAAIRKKLRTIFFAEKFGKSFR